MEIKNCILVTLSIRHWDANSLDKVVSKAVAEANGVKDQSMCRLRKSLLPKSEVMNTLFSNARAARNFHYENTHTWVHDGPRILTRANYDVYMQQMLRFQSEFRTSVLDFWAQYDDIKGTAQEVLGELYKESDYPDKNTLLDRYGFEISRLPMPQASSLLDFGLDEREAKELQLKLEQDMTETFTRANQKMWDDLYERLNKLSSKLNEEGAYVMEETIEAARKLTNLVPRMNLTGDARLDSVASQIGEALKGVTAQGVKHDPSLRSRAAKETRAAVAQMQSAMKKADAAAALPKVAVLETASLS